MPEAKPARRRKTHLGWRHEVLVRDPGPPPRRPVPAEGAGLEPEWVIAQRRSEADINRPLLFALLALFVLATLFPLLVMVRVLPLLLALVGFLGCLVVALPIIVALVQGRQAVGERLNEEKDRLAEERRERELRLRLQQEEHADRHAEWQQRKQAYEAQPRWYSLEVPQGKRRVTVVGGTDTGWSALLTTIGASRLRDGGDLTVVDLSGQALAGQLVALTQRCGLIPRVWVLPADLPRMNLGNNLEASHRADILASTVLATDPRADIEADHAILVTIFGVLGADASVARVTAALGLLGLPGQADAHDDPALVLLSCGERAQLREAFSGDTAAVSERCPHLQRALIPFEGLGTRAEQEPYAQVKIIATDRSAGDFAGRAYGSYTLDSLSELLDLRARTTGPVQPWAHTIVLCGADALPGWSVQRLADAAAKVSAGLVLMYRRAGEDAVESLVADDGLPVVMRPPDAESATALAGFLGAGHRAELHRLTEIIGAALEDQEADAYVTDAAESVTAAVPVRYTAKSIAPLDLVRHMRSATDWGRTTAQAADHDDTAGSDGTDRLTDQRLDAYGLRRLPSTAMVVPGANGPLLADANPGILTLATATLMTTGEAGPERVAGPPQTPPPANVGPPPERLDWRRATDV
ncbi:hypothetical protein [Nocardiopsis ansamitocini]|uniref:Uncharacterized protein n=1 Tax=Nocardiopsis ansamitocini TaxID=1670832 RepID=A0A9W6UJU1_9ACTN|nr:hypothetical protein [Nocardiopsis ansamitocini]GLU49204.1 hypothetical protein Nans01_35550 [Nocardiopsis ansamitocini]